jgi:hypothetical protein
VDPIVKSKFKSKIKMKQVKQCPGSQDGGGKMYFTSDHLAFFDERLAVRHSKRLGDSTIIAKTKEQVEQDAAGMISARWQEEEVDELLDELSNG